MVPVADKTPMKGCRTYKYRSKNDGKRGNLDGPLGFTASKRKEELSWPHVDMSKRRHVRDIHNTYTIYR